MKSIIITGTSSGLGKALFDLLHPTEVNLLCISRRFLPYQEQLAKEHSNRITLLIKDLRDGNVLPTAEEFAHFLKREGTKETIFIHNAGIIDPIGGIGQLNRNQVLDAIAVNLTAPIIMTNAFMSAIDGIDHKIKVVYISSGAAKRVIEGWAVYCAAKAGSEMFFDVLAAQYIHDERVMVCNVNPGVMDTDMQSKIRGSDDKFFPSKERYVKLKEEGTLPSPQEVAKRIMEQYIL